MMSYMNTITIGMRGQFDQVHCAIVRRMNTWPSLREFNHSLEWAPRDYKGITLFRQ